MRILIVGANSKYAIEKPYLTYLSQIERVTYIDIFTAQNLFLEYYNKSIINKTLFRIGWSTIFDRINVQLKQKISQTKPDIILIFKGMEIYPATLDWIKGRKIKLVNYNPDNPFIFSGKGSGNKNVTNSIGLYDLHFTYNFEVKKKIEKEYKIATKILPFGFDLSEDVFIKCLNQPEIIKACFVGNPDKERAKFITGLAFEGVSIDIYGTRWDQWISHVNVSVFSPVYEEELWKTFRKYRVQLNFMRNHNLNSHNMRSFEVPGVGAIMIAPDTTEHQLYFENYKEVFLYKSIEDCAKIIKEVLSLSSTEANEIRENARKRSVNSGYSYKDRAKQLMCELQQL